MWSPGFFWAHSDRKRPSTRLAVFLVNYLAERNAVRHSDKIICLSERDSRLLQKVYGRPATHVSPMALEDKLPAGFEQAAKSPQEKFALFVGGVFYANRAGIAWFVEHVVPRIEIKTCIVGRGFEDLRQELERDGKVEVVGAVDHLADWYRDAHFVIAPIFDGSGMKTKVAEALMYGKKIVGTPRHSQAMKTSLTGRGGVVRRPMNSLMQSPMRSARFRSRSTRNCERSIKKSIRCPRPGSVLRKF